jgi:hypothetical protein
MPRIAAHNEDNPSATNNLAVFADPLNAGSDFHDFTTLFGSRFGAKRFSIDAAP